MECIQCGSEFVARRSTARYCSAACRKLAFQDDGVSVPGVSVPVSVPASGIPDFGGPDCQCQHCQTTRVNGHTKRRNHGPYMTANELAVAGYDGNCLSVPGHSDYVGVCEQVDGAWRIKPEHAGRKRPRRQFDMYTTRHTRQGAQQARQGP